VPQQSPSLEDWAVRSSEPVMASSADGTVLLSVREGKYFVLNATAAAIWAKLETPVRLRQIRDEIAVEFQVSPDEAGAATLEFVVQLAQLNIVIVQSAAFRPTVMGGPK